MKLLRIVLVVLLVGYLLTGVVQVRRGERAVVRRFGRVLPDHPEPGLWIGLPWGMDRVDRIEVDSVRSVTVGYRDDGPTEEGMIPAGQLLTGDHNLVNVQVVLQYKVFLPELVDFTLQADRVSPVLSRLVESCMADWVAGQNVDDVLLRGKNNLRVALISRVREAVKPYQLGVEILDARVAQIAPPDEVRDAFDGVSRAQTQIATLRYKAEQEAATQKRLAQADHNRIEQTAQAEATAKKIIARQEARRFTDRLRQYQLARDRNPNYIRQLWQDERSKLFNQMKGNNQIDLLDHHLNQGGLDLWTAPRLPGR